MEYLDHDELEKLESGRVSFDFKGYLFKAINLWKLVVVCIGFSLIIAYLINVRKQNVYKLDCLLYTSPSPRDKRQSRMPSSA